MLLLFCMILLATMPTQWDFEQSPVGQLPAGWSAAKTGEGMGSIWKVLAGDTSQVLAQTSSAGPNGLFNLCVADSSSYRDLELSVAIKAVAGKNDRGGGPVWRYRDDGNYYVARWNPLEDNFRVYKVVAGKRIQLGTADVKAPADRWHTIKITQVGDEIRCYLDGTLHLQAKDDTFQTAGKIGLWTKSDAVAHFDDLMATELK